MRYLAVILAGLTLGGAARAAEADRCFADWSSAAPVVQAERLASVRDLHDQARQHRLGDLVRVTLCAEHGNYVYRLLIREPSGNIATLIVDARAPQWPSRREVTAESALMPTRKH